MIQFYILKTIEAMPEEAQADLYKAIIHYVTGKEPNDSRMYKTFWEGIKTHIRVNVEATEGGEGSQVNDDSSPFYLGGEWDEFGKKMEEWGGNL